MRSAIDILTDRIADVARLVPRLLTGRVTSLSPLTIDGSGATEIEPAKLGWWTPVKYESVWMLTWSGKALVLGSSSPPPVWSSTGTISETPAGGATLVKVTLDSGQSVSLPFDSGYVPVAAHKVWIAWAYGAQGQGVVGGRTGQAPLPPVIPDPDEPSPLPPPPTTKVRGSTTVKATDVRTWRGGGWRSDTTKAYQGDWSGTGTNTGYWFYGDGFSQLKGATVLGVEIYIRRRGGGAFADEEMKIQRHTSKNRGSGQPSRTGSVINSPGVAIDEGDWFTMTSLISTVQAIVDAGQGGISCAASTKADYAAWAGVSGDGRDAMSGAIKISWERTA